MSITGKESEGQQVDNVTVESENSVNKLETTKKYWENNFYNPILDSIIIHLKTRFSEESQTLANSTEHFFKLDYDGALYFINYYKVNINNER